MRRNQGRLLRLAINRTERPELFEVDRLYEGRCGRGV